jgi:hypothetical protein
LKFSRDRAAIRRRYCPWRTHEEDCWKEHLICSFHRTPYVKYLGGSGRNRYPHWVCACQNNAINATGWISDSQKGIVPYANALSKSPRCPSRPQIAQNKTYVVPLSLGFKDFGNGFFRCRDVQY